MCYRDHEMAVGNLMIVTKTSGEDVDVRIEVDGDDAFAYDGAKRIAEVLTTGEDDLGRGNIVSPTITYMHVDKEYRRNGIGLVLIGALVEQFGTLQPAQRNIGMGDLNALTDEGEALTRRAQEEGLVAPFPEEHPEYHDDDY